MVKKTRRELFAEIRALEAFNKSAALKIGDFLKERNENSLKRSQLISNITDLTKDLEKEKQSKESILYQGNQRSQLIRDIFRIISGEAQPTSKCEVIKDLFSDQISEIEGHKDLREIKGKLERISYKYNEPFLTEDIKEDQNLYMDRHIR